MKVTAIQVTKNSVLLHFDEGCAGEVTLRECVPTVGKKPGRTLCCTTLACDGRTVSLPRFEGGHDRIYSAWQVWKDGQKLEGVRYTTDIDEDVAENRFAYPQPEHIKAFGGSPELLKEIGAGQTLMNINLPALMTTHPGEGILPFEFDGETFYVLESAVAALDDYISRYPLVTCILLNSPKLFGSTKEEALLERCLHPGYDADYPSAFISAFDMETEEGQRYFAAFVEFLAQRYTRADHKYGCIGGVIVSNEVDSQYVWGNAGEMPVEQYTEEYTEAMRLAWICGKKHYSNFRVYISLDQYWDGLRHDVRYPERYYSGRTVLDCVCAHTQRDGNFGWNVAYHPYPEDLRWPAFWHDRTADFTFSTPRITFRNLEMLPAYLSQPQFLYKGSERRIIFSEQGFNSHSDELKDLTEKQAAAGYVLAYMKARQLPTVDLMTHHSTVDNPHEFGLNLGVFRYDPEKPDHFGEPKPIYYSVKAMDTAQEAAAVEKARAFIGEDLFDYLLHPPVQKADRDTSKDNQFGA